MKSTIRFRSGLLLILLNIPLIIGICWLLPDRSQHSDAVPSTNHGVKVTLDRRSRDPLLGTTTEGEPASVTLQSSGHDEPYVDKTFPNLTDASAYMMKLVGIRFPPGTTLSQKLGQFHIPPHQVIPFVDAIKANLDPDDKKRWFELPCISYSDTEYTRFGKQIIPADYKGHISASFYPTNDGGVPCYTLSTNSITGETAFHRTSNYDP